MAYGRGGGVRELVLRAVWRKGEAALGEDMDLVSKAEELLGSCSSIFPAYIGYNSMWACMYLVGT